MKVSKSNRTHTMQNGNSDFVIEKLLPLGKDSAVSTKILMALLDCSERELRARVAYERNQGAIICSCNQGYFKPADKEELREFYKGLQKQAISIFKVLRSTRKALEETDGQQELEVEQKE